MKKIYLLTLILLQLHVHAQIVTSEVKVEETGNITTINGKVGIGTATPDPASGLHMFQDRYTLYGPNSTWGGYLYVGGNGRTTDLASVVATNGNLHLDSKGGYKTYINHYSSGSTILNTNGGSVGIGTSAPGATLDVKRGTATGGTAQFSGTERTTHFNYSTDEHTYIRGGKTTSNVYINDNGGNVGIGTTSPTQKLEINGFLRVGALYNTNIQMATKTWSGSHAILFNATTSPTFVSGGLTTTGNTKFANDEGSNGGGAAGIFYNGNGGNMYFMISGASTGQGTDIAWGTAPMMLTRSGNIGIGTHSPTYKLHVNGSVKGTTLHTSTQSWSDFVFDDQYKLPTLESVEKFIQSEKHLPDIPSEQEVLKNGINLGEMDAMLLRKIEELTLYTIEQEKEIENLKLRIKNSPEHKPMANSPVLPIGSQQLMAKQIEELTLYTIEQEKEIENLKLRIKNSPEHKPMANSPVLSTGSQQLIAKQLAALLTRIEKLETEMKNEE